MKLLVTGGSSFVGAHFCKLAARTHEVVALYHTNKVRLNGVTPLRADLRRTRDLSALEALDVDAVVHIACKIRGRGATKEEDASEVAARINGSMMDSVLALGKPVVYASSTVVHWNQDTPYARSRRDDEQRLADSGLPYVILRPSAPYGPRLANHTPRHKESFHTLVELVRGAPVVPVIGDGQYRRQPLHVDDFSAAILAFLDQGLPNRAFDIGGAEAMTFDDVIDAIGGAMHKKVRKLHLPKALFVQVARFSPDFDPSLIAAVDEDEVADPTELTAACGVAPRDFRQGVRCLV